MLKILLGRFGNHIVFSLSVCTTGTNVTRLIALVLALAMMVGSKAVAQWSQEDLALNDQESVSVNIRDLVNILDSRSDVLEKVMSEVNTFGNEDECNPRDISVNMLPKITGDVADATALSVNIHCNNGSGA